MRAIGLNFQKGRFRVAVLNRDSSGTVSFHDARAITVDPDLPVPELMERYAAQLRIQFDDFHPGVVAARQVWNAGNVEGAVCQIAPFGIAAYVCNERSIPFRYYTPQAIRQPAPLGLLKGVNPITVIDQTFGAHPPYWDEMQRGAVVVAWRALREQ